MMGTKASPARARSFGQVPALIWARIKAIGFCPRAKRAELSFFQGVFQARFQIVKVAG